PRVGSGALDRMFIDFSGFAGTVIITPTLPSPIEGRERRGLPHRGGQVYAPKATCETRALDLLDAEPADKRLGDDQPPVGVLQRQCRQAARPPPPHHPHPP